MDLDTMACAMYSMAVQKRAAAQEAAGPMRDHLFSEANMCDAVAVKLDQMIDALHRVNAWAGAYPRDMFTPPTNDETLAARAALKSIGLTPDQFNGHAMRHVAEGMAKLLNGLNS